MFVCRRGPAGEWYDAVCVLLRQSKAVREWFAKFVLFSHPDRFSEYLLECPSGEVRYYFPSIQYGLIYFISCTGTECSCFIVPVSISLCFVGTKCLC